MLTLHRRRPRCRALVTIALLLIVGLVAVLPSMTPASQAQPQPIEQMRAFWVDDANPGFRNHPQVDELVENVVRANANTIIAQMRRHGDARYNNSIEPRAADPRLAPAEEFDPLAYLIEKAHSRGIKVHAWLVVTVTCRDRDRLRGHPQHVCTAHGPGVSDPERWTTATYGGQQIGDLDFGHPGAILHMESVVQHLLRNYPGLDGIHFDFIRYSGQAYGYNRVSLDRFNRAHGFAPNNRPAPGDALWSQWRRDRMTELMRRLYIRSKEINPQVQVSIAAITWGGIGSYTPDDWPNSAAYNTVFQDWRAWLDEGIIDFALPMHYFEEGTPRTRGWYDGWLDWGRINTGRRAIVAGTGAWLNSREQGIAQLQRALTPDGGGRVLSGVALYSYDQPFAGSNPERRREFMDQLRATVFAEPARVPVWPWIANPTTGHLQGMATIDGQVVSDAKVSLIKDGVWLRDLAASYDGWYGAVDLEPGAYTVVVHGPNDRTVPYEVFVRPGLVTNGT